MPELADRLRKSLADRYRIERELGRGGMATVFLAHDLRHDRPVALKVNRGIDEKDIYIPEYFFEPFLDPLRKDARFAQIVRPMGLAETDPQRSAR